MSAIELLEFIGLTMTAAMLAARATRSMEPAERGLVLLAFAAHPVTVVVHVLLTELYFGGGDAMGYELLGGQLAELIRVDPETFVPPVVQLFFQIGEPIFPFAVYGIGHSTGSMHATAAALNLLSGGGGLYVMSLVVSLGTFFSSLALFQGLKAHFPETTHRQLAVALLLVPTTVYWNSGLLKEPIAVIGLCVALVGFDKILKQRRLRGLLIFAVGALIVALFKPYILFPMAVGLGLWSFIRRSSARSVAMPIKPLYFLIGGVMTLGALVLLGRIFPKFALDRLAESAADQQRIGIELQGGSSYSMGNESQRSMLGQLLFAPLALLTALFRPLPFEARNAASFVNTLETLTLTVLSIRAILTNSWAWIWRTIMGNTVLVFCLSFVFVMATAVGLSTTNFGTLSRYRSPFVPFLAILVLTINAQVAEQLRQRRLAILQGRTAGTIT